MNEFLAQHSVAALAVAAYVLVALVSTMPAKNTPWSGQVGPILYAWFYDFLHMLLNAAEKRYPGLGVGTAGAAGAAGPAEIQTVTVVPGQVATVATAAPVAPAAAPAAVVAPAGVAVPQIIAPAAAPAAPFAQPNAPFTSLTTL